MNSKVVLLALAVAACGAGRLEAQLLPGEREAAVTAIAGVVDDGRQWELAWAGFDNADGIVGTADGGLLFAQEQPSTVRKLDPDGRDSVYLRDTHGAGALSVDRQGRLLAVQRAEPPMISVLAPERRVLAKGLAGGRPLGRPNDLVADARGGAYFTVIGGGAYYVAPDGTIRTVAEDIRSNGIMLSPDETRLYATDGTTILAFDVGAGGAVTNRRVFATVDGRTGGDGMAVDGAGRVYVTAGYTIQVFSSRGEPLGVIPTPRQVITLAFSGPGKRTLYTVGHGAVGADGVERTERPAKTIYRLRMLAEGYAGRAK